MTKASISTVVDAEAAHFGRLAADWWNPNGSSAMLHKLNPVRLRYVRGQIDRHFGKDSAGLKPLAGMRVLDVGCGAGLLCEPLARLGGDVTGIDAAPENIAAARAHAAGSGLAIDYRDGDFAAMELGRFDLVTSMEVIEHVADPADFVAALAQRLAPGGLMILSTPNRTAASRLLLVEAAERLGGIPRGTHDWDKFLTPEEVTDMLHDAGMEVFDIEGIGFDISRGLHLGPNKSLNYILAARAAVGTR